MYSVIANRPVTSNIFRARVQHYGSPEVQRILQVRTEERVIHNNPDAGSSSRSDTINHGTDIGYLESWVCRRL
jgi:hypothetical protein